MIPRQARILDPALTRLKLHRLRLLVAVGREGRHPDGRGSRSPPRRGWSRISTLISEGSLRPDQSPRRPHRLGRQPEPPCDADLRPAVERHPGTGRPDRRQSRPRHRRHAARSVSVPVAGRRRPAPDRLAQVGGQDRRGSERRALRTGRVWLHRPGRPGERNEALPYPSEVAPASAPSFFSSQISRGSGGWPPARPSRQAPSVQGLTGSTKRRTMSPSHEIPQRSRDREARRVFVGQLHRPAPQADRMTALFEARNLSIRTLKASLPGTPSGGGRTAARGAGAGPGAGRPA